MRSLRREPAAFVAALLFLTATASGQRAVRFDPSRPLAPYRTAAVAAQDTLRLLAIMVEFVPDTDVRTTGNGRFDSTLTHPAIVDPPPHNAAYFNAKLRFVENYFRRVSDGKLIIQGDLLPNVLRVDRTMADYAVQTSPTFRGLARLAVDAWHKADSASPGTNFASYDAFVLFHAGTGKDIDLVGIFGYDPAPYDLPSVYLSLNAFRSAFDSTAFNGIAVSGGSFRITNTMILPETETRSFASSVGADTLELSINGLFAASVGSHLGLPDLFDTKTGRPGIGQFGLMDGAAIFAYQGICPPEPSAWEKMQLGWVTPVDVTAAVDTLRLPAVGLTTVQDTVYRVRITDSEYYLVENRHRDPAGNGQRLTIYRNGVTSVLSLPTDSTGFYTFDVISGIDGSVIDVEDPDWSLIGRFGTDGRFDGGGVLIWHIDEGVIAAGRADNTVNADVKLRGVDLEEADGSQDIGESYAFLQGGAGSESGSPLDAWFQGNEARPYTNRFDDASFPNSRSNRGAASLITIRDFSPRGVRMTAIVERGTARMAPLAGFPKQMNGVLGPATVVDVDGNGHSEFVTTRVLRSGPSGRTGSPVGQGAILAWTPSGVSATNVVDSSGLAALVDEPIIGTPAFAPHPSGGTMVAAAAAPGRLYVWRTADGNADQRWDEMARIALPADTVAWSTLIVDTLVVAYGAPGIVVGSIHGATVASFTPGAQAVAWTGSGWRFVAGVGNSIYRLEISAVSRSLDAFVPIGSAGSPITGIVASNVDGSSNAVAVQSKGAAGASHITILDGTDLSVAGVFNAATGLAQDEIVLPNAAFADVDRDGRKELMLPTSNGRVVMMSVKGVWLDGSPRTLAGRSVWNHAELLAANVGSDGASDLLAVDDRGVLTWTLPGAPAGFQVGNDVVASASVGVIQTPQGASTALFVADASGGVWGFDLKSSWDAGAAAWTSRSGGPSRASYVALPTASPTPIASGVLPADRVYNWPNPVYGNETRIRFYTQYDGTATVTIFDLAGDVITTLTSPAVGGQDNEIMWDVREIQSGVYLAKVEVKGSGGSGERVVKVAVVK